MLWSARHRHQPSLSWHTTNGSTIPMTDLISKLSCRLSEEASEEEKNALQDLEQQYMAKERCGVFPEGGIEYYLLARSKLASGLLDACQTGDLPPQHLLVVAVHLKVHLSSEYSSCKNPQHSSCDWCTQKRAVTSHIMQVAPVIKVPV